MEADVTSRYDSRRDAALLAAPLGKWARIGFLRGFAGIRKEILPVGAMALPSKVFAEVAYESLETVPRESEEYAARLAYINEVEEILRGKQNEFVENHYVNSIWGHVGDFVTAVMFVALGWALIATVGPFDHLTLFLLALMGIKIMFLQVSVHRAIGIAQQAFQTRREQIVLPWDRGTAQ